MERSHRKNIRIQSEAFKTFDHGDRLGELSEKETFESFEEPPLWISIFTYLGYAILILFAHFRECLQKFGVKRMPIAGEALKPGWVPLCQDFEALFSRHMYRRVRDCWNRPICSVPGAYVHLMDRYSKDHGWTFNFTGSKTRALNMASYNYLGYAEDRGYQPHRTEEAVATYGSGVASTRQEMGSLAVHLELERLLARFLRVESAVTFGMGFATNTTVIPSIVGQGCLVVSDELNHASLVLGIRLSGAKVAIFQHNDMGDLERRLEEAVTRGQPGGGEPWRKILIVVEGIYSMEGSLIKLPEVLRLKKKYKAYLYLDEAHSIGAVGPSGRGVTDYWGCDPKEVDIMMGTFSKSFGAFGGYVAGSKQIVDYIKVNSHSACYATSMPAAVAQKIISSTSQIMGLDGTSKGQECISRLAWNCRYFRRRLHEMGFVVYGNMDSPVVPIVLNCAAKVVAFSRECLQRGLATVIVGFPATPLTKGRARFCLSAAHDKRMLDEALRIIDEVGSLLALKYSSMPVPPLSETDPAFSQRYKIDSISLKATLYSKA